MAIAERPAPQARSGGDFERRPRRERDEEVLVWPDLVFVEFICAVLFTITLTILSTAISGPLLGKANGDATPNPSKAPWYFLNLQELLLHMHPALAGVVVPTIFLIVLAAMPYFDRSNEGQGVWFGTPRAGLLTAVGATVGAVGSLLLILYDGSIIPRWPNRRLRHLSWAVGSVHALPHEISTALAGRNYQWRTSRTKVLLRGEGVAERGACLPSSPWL